jgi:hypothetical protein
MKRLNSPAFFPVFESTELALDCRDEVGLRVRDLVIEEGVIRIVSSEGARGSGGVCGCSGFGLMRVWES